MQADIDNNRDALAAICLRYGVARLEVFGSAARGAGFLFLLEKLLGRRVDLLEREAIEASRNFIRRRAILKEAETVYG